jgi:hypothetical protein
VPHLSIHHFDVETETLRVVVYKFAVRKFGNWKRIISYA